MSTPKRPPHRLPAEAVGQWRLLRSSLNDLLTRLFIATIAVGGLIVADVSHSGTRPMEKVGAIAGGIFIVLAIFGWSFNAQPIRQGVLISLGVWLIVRAFLPRVQDSPLPA